MCGLHASDLPMIFKLREKLSPAPPSREWQDGAVEIGWRTRVRALEGLQKEALVTDPVGDTWRLVSDEGKQLGGAELAPCPLEYFAAGVLFSLMAELLNHARVHGVEVAYLAVEGDHRYSVGGSAFKRDILAAANPAEIVVKIGSRWIPTSSWWRMSLKRWPSGWPAWASACASCMPSCGTGFPASSEPN
jgi:hypothetical protein